MAARKKTTHRAEPDHPKPRRNRRPRRHRKANPNARPRGSDGRFEKALVNPREFMPVDELSLGLGTEHSAEQMQALADAPFLELGSTGLRQYSGVIDEEFLPALRGRRAIQVYTEMKDNDPTIGAMLFAVEMLMRNVDWRVEPASDSPQDLELANFIDEARNDMSETWHDTLASIFSFLPFGFSVHEEVYKRRDGHHPEEKTRDSRFDDGRIGWQKLPVRAQDTINRWIFDPDGSDDLIGLVQLPPPSFTLRVIPERKFLLFRTTAAKANPQGRSVLRNAYRPWYFKRRIEEIEGIGVERDLAGLPMMQVPAEIMDRNAPPNKRAVFNDIRAMLRDVRRDEREGIIVPRELDKDGNDLYTFELVKSGGRRQFDTTQIVNRYDRQIASVVLADFILLGQQRVGSFALAETKTELFGFALGAWLDSVTEVFNRNAIPRLLMLNGMPVETPPKLVHGDIETQDLAELADFAAKLSGAGVTLFPDDDLENFLRIQAGFPEKKPETEDEAAEREAREELEALRELAAAEALRGEPEPTPPVVPDDEDEGDA